MKRQLKVVNITEVAVGKYSKFYVLQKYECENQLIKMAQRVQAKK